MEDLVAVSLPGDEHAVCCPECREHAESVASDASAPLDDLRGECEGCGASNPVDAFETVSLPDGSTVAVCEDCHEHAESMAERTSVTGRRGECSGCGERFDVSDMTAVELDDGTTVACCTECAEYARAAARTTADEPDDDAVGDASEDDAWNWTGDVPDGAAATGAANTEADAAADASKDGPTNADADLDADASPDADANSGVADTSPETALVESPSICDQCGDWVDVELFEVVTVTERVEEFCPPCKDRARRNGVVRDVRMRRAEAYDVLGVDPGRDESVVRDAYLSQIKVVHPDSDGGSREAFRRVQRAYERLTD